MHRLLPPLLLILATALMLLLHRFVPGPHVLPAGLRIPGMAAIVAGLAIAVWHARLFRRRGTNLNTFREPQVLVTSGLFRYSRNPMYLGFAVALAGVALLLGAVTPALVLPVFILLVDRWYIRFEERILLRVFGDAYREYCGQVRRWL